MEKPPGDHQYILDQIASIRSQLDALEDYIGSIESNSDAIYTIPPPPDPIELIILKSDDLADVCIEALEKTDDGWQKSGPVHEYHGDTTKYIQIMTRTKHE